MNAAQIARYNFRALWWQAVNRSLSERGKDEAIWLEIQWRFEYGLPIGAAVLDIIEERSSRCCGGPAGETPAG